MVVFQIIFISNGSLKSDTVQANGPKLKVQRLFLSAVQFSEMCCPTPFPFSSKLLTPQLSNHVLRLLWGAEWCEMWDRESQHTQQLPNRTSLGRKGICKERGNVGVRKTHPHPQCYKKKKKKRMED